MSIPPGEHLLKIQKVRCEGKVTTIECEVADTGGMATFSLRAEEGFEIEDDAGERGFVSQEEFAWNADAGARLAVSNLRRGESVRVWFRGRVRDVRRI